jgi:hypothetical protein
MTSREAPTWGARSVYEKGSIRIFGNDGLGQTLLITRRSDFGRGKVRNQELVVLRIYALGKYQGRPFLELCHHHSRQSVVQEVGVDTMWKDIPTYDVDDVICQFT